MTTAIAKRSNLPAPVAALFNAIQPVSVVKNLAAVGGGFVLAQLGGRLVKMIDAVEHFASGGAVQEMVVDLAAGLVLDAAVLAAVAASKGKDLAFRVGKLLVVGTIIGAVLPVVAQHLADAIEKVVNMVTGKSAATSPPIVPSNGASAPQLPAAGGLADWMRPAGGLADYVAPGGNPYQYAAA